jgi:hypothetical protein
MKSLLRVGFLSALVMMTILSSTPGHARKVVWISQDPPPSPPDMNFLEGYYRQIARAGDTMAVGGDINNIWCTTHSGDTFIVIGHGIRTAYEGGEEVVGGGIKINGDDYSGFAPRGGEGGGTGLSGYEPYRLIAKPDTLALVQLVTCWSSHIPDDSVRPVTDSFDGLISSRSPHPQGYGGLVEYGDVGLVARGARAMQDSLKAALNRAAQAGGFNAFGPWLQNQPFNRHKALLDSIIRANCIVLDLAYWWYSGPEAQYKRAILPQMTNSLDDDADTLFGHYYSEASCTLPSQVIVQGVSNCLHLMPSGTVDVTFYSHLSGSPVFTVSVGCAAPCAADGCIPVGTFRQRSFWASDTTWIELITNLTDDEGCVCLTLETVLAVELTSFSATTGDQEVRLHWITASEAGNDHFVISRDDRDIAQVPSQGNSAESHTYSYVDIELTNGAEYHYALAVVDVQGHRQELRTVEATPGASASLITEYALYQNYPNPFNPRTQIVFDMKDAGAVTLIVYNLLGQEIMALIKGEMNAGHHTVIFDSGDLPSGLYIYKMEANGFSAQNKMLLMK